ncbi:MAG: S8 family peptidase [bacterium]|nr:S8 family peptidase [bacterium]
MNKTIKFLLLICFGIVFTGSTVSERAFFTSKEKFKIAKTNGIELSSKLKGATKGEVDTITPELASPFYIYPSEYRKSYKATKFTPMLPCSLQQIWVGAGGSTAGTKICSVFVWSDAGTFPGTILFSDTMTFAAESAGYLYWNSHILPAPIRMAGSFWVGSKENDTLFPTTGFDETMSLPSQFSFDGSSWVAGDSITFDYMNAVAIKYELSGTADISASPSPLVMQITAISKKSLLAQPSTPPLPLLSEDDEKYWQDIVPGEFIIGYTNQIDVKKATLKQMGIAQKSITLADKELGDNFILVKVAGTLEEEKTFVKKMKVKSNIASIEPNRIIKLFKNPNDPYFSSYQWDKRSVKAPEAWVYGWGNDSISIGIVDQGAQYTHPDLSARYTTVKRYDYVDNDADPINAVTAESHGTHCSGNAAATVNNGVGIAGMSNARLYSLRVMGSSGGGTSTAIGNGVQWCATNHIKIVSMSIGGGSPSSFVNAKCQAVWNGGGLLFAASGNDGKDTTAYPAAYANVIAVGSIGTTNTRSSFSNYGSYLDLVAPGENICSTIPGSTYETGWSGTSMACPQAAGGAALVWAANTSLTNAQVRDILCNTATDLGTTGWDKEYGWGKLNLQAAVLAAKGSSAMSGDTGMVTIYNSSSATGNLAVSGITYHSSWISSVSPTSFGIVPGESEGVTVIVLASLETGYYYDTLFVASNDPDNNPYLVPVVLKVGDVGTEEITDFGLRNAELSIFPNPATKALSIKFAVPASQNVSLKIYNTAGRLVKTVFDEVKTAGTYNPIINMTGMNSGIYFVLLKTGNHTISKKVTLIK